MGMLLICFFRQLLRTLFSDVDAMSLAAKADDKGGETKYTKHTLDEYVLQVTTVATRCHSPMEHKNCSEVVRFMVHWN
jgi:hypothetical protein